jgi:3-deoxy-manno-octulosonate cytidylyltransferase (CMP-KDO synthetase)
MDVIGLIPARFGSKRFPGKPLSKIFEKTLIQLTWENASQVIKNLWVVTDDPRIGEHVESFGGKVIYSPQDLSSGTERIAWALGQKNGPNGNIVVNIQGDEPCLSHEAICEVIKTLQNSPDAVMATPVVEMMGPEMNNPHHVKCVTDKFGKALYFSRSPIPYRASSFKKHLGLYAYRKEFLLKLPTLEDTPLQKLEDLEQLKVIEHGYTIQTCTVSSFAPSVDVPEDIKIVENYICQKNLSLLQGASAPH